GDFRVNIHIDILHFAVLSGLTSVAHFGIETDFSGARVMPTRFLEERATARKSLIEIRCRFAAYGIIAEFAKDRRGFSLRGDHGKNCAESQNLLSQIHVLAPLSKTSKKFAFCCHKHGTQSSREL